jgi:transcriptional regulator GlxA family with amidase domain
VVSRLPGAKVTFVAAEPGPVATDNRMLKITAEQSLDDLPNPDIVIVPGGIGTRAMMSDTQLVSWVRNAHRTTDWTCSVCTGSLILGAAGLLDGLEATTHWMAMDTLASTGARPTGRRVVEQGKIITAAGVSAGIDMGLTLAARIAGDDVAQAIQLGIEYDPQPPFDAGSPEKAPENVVAICRGVEALIDAGEPIPAS